MTKATRPSTTLTATRADSVVLSCATPGSLRQALFSIAETHAISRRHERTTKYENKIFRSREFRPPPGPRSVHTLHLCRDCISVVSVSPTRELSPLRRCSLSVLLVIHLSVTTRVRVEERRRGGEEERRIKVDSLDAFPFILRKNDAKFLPQTSTARSVVEYVEAGRTVLPDVEVTVALALALALL